MANIIIGVVIAAFIIYIIAWMIKNVKNGKSFCGADIGEPLNIKEMSGADCDQKKVNNMVRCYVRAGNV